VSLAYPPFHHPDTEIVFVAADHGAGAYSSTSAARVTKVRRCGTLSMSQRWSNLSASWRARKYDPDNFFLLNNNIAPAGS
jgi:hypothetical protein